MLPVVFYEMGHEEAPLHEMFLPFCPCVGMWVHIKNRAYLVAQVELLADKQMLRVWVHPGA